jgi:hypothetical protein
MFSMNASTSQSYLVTGAGIRMLRPEDDAPLMMSIRSNLNRNRGYLASLAYQLA